MGVPNRYILHQGSVLRALGQTAVAAFRQRGGDLPSAPPPLPGPELVETVPPRPRELVRDYVKHVGGDPSAYKRTLPPHLFPQWGFGLAARTLTGIPYPLVKVMNGGCRLEVIADLPIDEPLEVRARLEDIDDDGRRAVLHQRIVTGTREHPEAVVGHLYAIVPLGSGKSNGAPKPRSSKDKPRVPDDAREVGFFRVRHNAGLEFAKLTGDFNPVHWVPPYARAFGFKDVILHGFATMARAIEGLNRSVFAGDVHRIRVFDCKFTRPLVLPARVGLYVTKNDGVFVGDAPGGPAYLVGSFEADRNNGAAR
jgi:hypothetical protein